jgi:hypothetical protein
MTFADYRSATFSLTRIVRREDVMEIKGLAHALCGVARPRSSGRLPYALFLRHVHVKARSNAPLFRLTLRPRRCPADPIALRARLQTRAETPPSIWNPQKWELTVGIEVHAQLQADRKLFSRGSKPQRLLMPSYHRRWGADASSW